MFDAVMNKINEVRASDPNTKRRWLIASSATTMIVVIVLWSFYLNASVESVREAREQKETHRVEQPGFWSTMAAGFSAFKDNLADLLHSFGQGKTLEITRDENL